MIMREVAIKHGMQSAKDVLRRSSRVLLKVISTGNQLRTQHDHARCLPGLGPERDQGRRAAQHFAQGDPVPTMHTMDTAWEVNLKTSVELYTIWEATGVLDQLETIDENLFDVVNDVMDEKRDEYKEWLEETQRRSGRRIIKRIIVAAGRNRG